MSNIAVKEEFLEVERKIDKVFLSIGEYYSSKDPVWVTTLLGSCVAVCLYDNKIRAGGINHIFLPGNRDTKKYSDSARYGINAMELLINSMLKIGCMKKNMQAKVFGGANVISGISENLSVGPDISAFVLDFLKTENIPVKALDIGGNRTRKLLYNTDSGEVLVKRSASGYFRVERKIIKKVGNVKIKEDVTLF